MLDQAPVWVWPRLAEAICCSDQSIFRKPEKRELHIMNTWTKKAGILLKGKNKKAWTMVLILIGMIILSSILSPSFRSARNLLNILNQNSIYGIMALGMGCVILTGAIDLSAGSTAALAAVIATPLFRDYGFVAGMLGGLCLGALVGLINGILITKCKITYFVTTLGTMQIGRGIVYIITSGIPIQGVPAAYNVVGMGKLFGTLPIAALIWFGCVIIMHFVLKYTQFGQHLYAIGGSENAAWLAGVNTNKMKVLSFVLCGFFCALSGLILNLRVLMATADACQSYEMTAIASCVVGGLSMDGGRGDILSSITGTLIMGLILNILQLLGVSSYWQTAVTGVIIIATVAIDSISSRKRD